TNGSLDTSFAVVVLQFNTDENLNSVAVGPDGRIVLAGWAPSDSTGYDLVLERYNASGVLDTTFGSGGVVVAPVPLDQYGESLTLQPDGKIVVAGQQEYGVFYYFLVARFNGADGSPDSSFGVNGVATSGSAQSISQPGLVAPQY